MKIFFKPASSLLDRLRYPLKFTLIGTLLIIPIAVLVFLLSSEINSELEFNQKEKIGSEYNNALKNLLINVQQHRGMTYVYQNGNSSFREKITEKQKELEEDVLAVNEIDKKYGEALKTTEKWNNLKNDWDEIKNNLLQREAMDNFNKHTELVNGILSLIVNVGDISNLELDSTLVGNHLANNLLHTIPLLTEELGKLRAVGSGIVEKKSISVDDRVEFISSLSTAESLFKDLNEDISIIFENDKNIEKKLSEQYQDVFKATNDFIALSKDKIIQAEIIGINSAEYFDIATGTIDKMINLYEAQTNVLTDYLEERINELTYQKYLVISLVSLMILLAVYMLIGTYISVIDSVSSLEKAAKQLENGDLTTTVNLKTKDELLTIGNAFNKMAESFKQIIKESGEIAQEVAASAEELTASYQQINTVSEQINLNIQQVADGVESQAIGTVESANALEEMSKGNLVIAENASSVSRLSIDSIELAEEGKEFVQKNVQQMSSITQSVSESDKTIKLLDNSSKEIEKVIEVITEIASQTNLLALNASIEAARAGEHGRGFAVVANEVRKLAEQTELATTQIGNLIKEIQKEMTNSSQSMDTVKNDVALGLNVAKATEQKFMEILNSMKQISSQMQEVSATAQQISAGAQEVTASINEIAEISKESSLNTQNIASASEEQHASMEEISAQAAVLTEMAEKLQSFITKFKVR